MIGNIVTDPTTGEPMDGTGKSVSRSIYQPPKAVMDLFARCQADYQTAWSLQHRPFDEFDGLSLLNRANVDQQTWGAYVGAEYVPKDKEWRWRGRKNTARNKIIGVLAQLISAILIPTVYATDDQENESAECARAMRLLVQEHLRRAGYEIKFIYMVLSALVNPAVFVEVQYVQKLQTIKTRLRDGSIKIEQAVDELMSGLALNVVPIDELLLGDFFTYDMQAQPFIVRIRRISYDVARGIYGGRYFDKAPVPTDDMTDEEKAEYAKLPKANDNGMIDRFDYVQAGKTRVFMAAQENQTLYDIDWTEGDQNMVQVATFYYRGEDLQVTWVGGVFFGEFDETDPDCIYNINSMKHRRMTLINDAWGLMPVYPFAKSGCEPLDPQMRFAYYKSLAFKEYWDDATLNMMERLSVDGAHLDVFKPILISGISKYDSRIIAPGAVGSLPAGATVSPYQLGPNVAAAMNVAAREEAGIADSTISPILQGQLGPRQSATAIAAAVQNAKKMLSVATALTADLVRQVGDLTIDCIVTNTTIGEVYEELPGALGMKFQTMLIRGKEKNRDVTHKIIFTDRYIGKQMTAEEKIKREWELWHQGGGDKKGATKIWEINPYQLARRKYYCDVDAEEMLDMSVGAVQARKDKALAVLTSPAVAPFTDQEAVANDFAIEEYGGNDPDRYKRKPGAPDMAAGMGMMKPPPAQSSVDSGTGQPGLLVQ